MEDILSETIPVEDLKVFEEKYYREARQNGGAVSETAQFQYACCLIRSQYAADVRKGIHIFTELLARPASVDSESGSRRDYLYFLSLGYAKIKEYVEAMRHVRQLLEQEPGNRQARELQQVIDKRMKREAYTGMALTGGAVLALGGVVGLAVAMAKRH